MFDLWAKKYLVSHKRFNPPPPKKTKQKKKKKKKKKNQVLQNFRWGGVVLYSGVLQWGTRYFFDP